MTDDTKLLYFEKKIIKWWGGTSSAGKSKLLAVSAFKLKDLKVCLFSIDSFSISEPCVCQIPRRWFSSSVLARVTPLRLRFGLGPNLIGSRPKKSLFTQFALSAAL